LEGYRDKSSHLKRGTITKSRKKGKFRTSRESQQQQREKKDKWYEKGGIRFEKQAGELDSGAMQFGKRRAEKEI